MVGRNRVILSVLAFLVLFAEGARAQEQPFTIEHLSAQLERGNYRNLDALIASLPLFFRQSYTIAYLSNSLQAAWPDAPRVLLYGPSAEMIIAFNDENGEFGNQQLEIIQYRREQAKFDFFLVEPDAAGRFRASPGKNCAFCHTPDTRPNFQPYAHWPGFYGSDDDRLSGGLSLPEEKGWLDGFIATASARPRYRHLVGLKDQYSGVATSRTKVNHGFELTFRLAQLNYRRIARILSERADWAKYKYAWLAAVSCSSSFHMAFPESERPTERSWSQFTEKEAGKTSPFLFLADRLRINSFALSLQTPGVEAEAFRGNILGSGGSSAPEMAGQLMDWDPELRNYGTAFDYRRQEMSARMGQVLNCERLTARSRAALGEGSNSL